MIVPVWRQTPRYAVASSDSPGIITSSFDPSTSGNWSQLLSDPPSSSATAAGSRTHRTVGRLDISAVLYHIGQTRNDKTSFHWALAVGNKERRGSAVFESVNTAEPGAPAKWEYVFEWFEVTSMAKCAVVMKLGDVPDLSTEPDTSIAEINEIFSTIPIGFVPEEDRARYPKYTCVTWFREACRKLQESAYVQVDVDEVMEQCLSAGASWLALERAPDGPECTRYCAY